jgi:aminoglycoside phosphotransferase (APT) family kinase protein
LGREQKQEPPANAATLELGEAELRAWVAAATGGAVAGWTRISGGNRCRSWAVDVDCGPGRLEPLYLRYQPPRPPSAEPYTVWREAEVYRALAQTAIRAPRLIAAHPDHPAILTERARGRADFRRLTDAAEKQAIALDFIDTLAALHATPLDATRFGLGPGADMADAVAAEIAIWRAMYRETGRCDPLIELALGWLATHLPATDVPPAFVHGDAGPGNFLFEAGRMTALIDWELAHPGDPVEDLAWFSMRCVMEPVPDFAACLAAYARATGRPIDMARLHYHRVFVSARVVIIRHRNVTGEPGNSIVSRSLNRRLLVDALAAANGIALPPPVLVQGPPTPRTPLFDTVISDLRDSVASADNAPAAVSAAKNAAKVLKYLREVDRIGPIIAATDAAAFADLRNIETSGDTDADLCRAVADTRLPLDVALPFFADRVAREAQLAAPSSGGLATRTFPNFAKGQ